MVLPLYSWSTPLCVWLIALSKPVKPGCYTGITNSLEWKKQLCENSTETLSTCLCSSPSLPSCPIAAHCPLCVCVQVVAFISSPTSHLTYRNTHRNQARHPSAVSATQTADQKNSTHQFLNIDFEHLMMMDIVVCAF